MDITQIIQRAESGDTDAKAELIQAAYAELRSLASARIASERQDHTLTATALVHEVSLKLLESSKLAASNRSQFFGFAARTMRNLLIDHARTRGSQKRGGDRQRFAFEEAATASVEQSEDLIALNNALEQLANVDQRKAQVVEMRYFGGMTNDEVAAALDISKATVKRDWDVAKGWLLQTLRQ